MRRRTLGGRMPFMVCVLMGALLATPALWAQQSEEASVLRLFYQEKELVTAASRQPEEARTAPATVEVFTAEDIQNMGARTLSDLLRTLESVYVQTNDDSRESVWFRGIRTRYNDKVLLMVDGTPWRDIVYENAFINKYFPLCNVERVEVIRGPGSALYGTNAFAGVINVVTKRPPDKGYAEVMAGGGDYNTRESYIQGGYKEGSVGLYGWGNYFDTDGDGVDFDRYQRKQALSWNPKQNISGGLTFTAGELTLSAEKVHFYHTLFDDWDVPTWRWNDQGEGYWYNDTYLTASYQHSFAEGFSVRALAYYQKYDLHDFWRTWNSGQQGPNATPADVEDSIDVAKKGHRTGADFQATVATSNKNDMVCGLTYEREVNSQTTDHWYEVQTGVTTVPYYIAPVTITTGAIYAQDTWKPSAWATLTLGLRGDHSSVFGWKTSPRLSAAFHPGSKLVIKLLYGEAFRAPSCRELYTVTSSFVPGNPHLKPESIRTTEVSATYTFSQYVQAHLNLYYESTRNLIYADNGQPYENHPGAIIRGLETGLQLAWPNRITAYANYSHTQTDEYEVPRNLAHAGVNVPWGGHFNWNMNAICVSSRPRDPEDLYAYDPSKPPYHRPDVPAYITFNTTMRFLKVWHELELDASIYNVFGKTYYDPSYQPTSENDIKAPGRTFVVRAVYRF